MNVLVVGTGAIGIEYTRILKAQGISVIAIGRSEASCQAFEDETEIKALRGGMDAIRNLNDAPPYAIVAVSEGQLSQVTDALLGKGISRILVEKPGGTLPEDVRKLALKSTQNSTPIYVAYNRRFHSSTLSAEKIIHNDGGVKSFNFEFTEWSHKIEPLIKEPGIKEQWFFHNSTHVVDLAFYLGGWPQHLSAFTSGKLVWHPIARYSGSGITESGAIFSYFADWEGAGRWGVEILTSKHRLIFKPLEKLFIQKVGSIAIEAAEIDDSLDIQFKPGFYRQVEAFLHHPDKLLSIQEQVKHLDIFEQINSIKI